jgi:hypothetical protein
LILRTIHADELGMPAGFAQKSRPAQIFDGLHKNSVNCQPHPSRRLAREFDQSADSTENKIPACSSVIGIRAIDSCDSRRVSNAAAAFRTTMVRRPCESGSDRKPISDAEPPTVTLTTNFIELAGTPFLSFIPASYRPIRARGTQFRFVVKIATRNCAEIRLPIGSRTP